MKNEDSGVYISQPGFRCHMFTFDLAVSAHGVHLDEMISGFSSLQGK